MANTSIPTRPYPMIKVLIEQVTQSITQYPQQTNFKTHYIKANYSTSRIVGGQAATDIHLPISGRSMSYSIIYFMTKQFSYSQVRPCSDTV